MGVADSIKRIYTKEENDKVKIINVRRNKQVEGKQIIM